MTIRRTIAASSVLLLLLFAAWPAAAQQAPPASERFPGIAWGVAADSVIRAWGEPASRGTTRRGLDELNYVERRDGRTYEWYILVHPTLGTLIAGYTVAFETEAQCHALAWSALEVADRDYPRLWWEPGDKATTWICRASGGPGGVTGRDTESGTRIGIRLARDGEHLTMDAISPAGWRWVGTGN